MPDTVAVITSRADSVNSICTYGVPFSAREGHGEVLALRDGQRTVASESFASGDRAVWDASVPTGGCAHLTAGPTEAAPDSLLFSHNGSALSYRRLRSGDCPDWMAADVCLCFAPDVNLDSTMTPVVEHIMKYQYDVDIWRCNNSSPTTVPEAYAETVCANEAYDRDYPNGHRYAQRPILMIVGEGINPDQFYGDGNFCALGVCESFSMMTDLDGSGRPEGPVTVIFATTASYILKACQYADEFNDANANPHGGVAVFLGDAYDCDPNDSDPTWQEGPYERLLAAYEGGGCPVRCKLRESMAPCNRSVLGPAGRDCLDRGVRDLWVQGVSTWEGSVTALWDLGYPPTVQQRVVIFAPQCQSVAHWWGKEVNFSHMDGCLFVRGNTVGRRSRRDRVSMGIDSQQHNLSRLMVG